MALSGLGTISDLALLQPVPADKAALRSKFSMGRGNLSLELSVNISGRAMPIEIGLATVMEGLELGLQGRLSVNTSALNALALEQFSHPVCWLRTILEGVRCTARRH